MQRVITGLWLLAGAIGCLAGETSEAPPPVYRYLILIEAGSAMSRQKEVALDTVHQLILGGMNGRIGQGDVLGIWPFRKDIDRTLCRPVHWRTAEARDLGNFIYRKLRDLEFAKQSNVESALEAVKNEAQHSERLTVFLITSGGQPVRGTGFDEEINSVFRQHAEGMTAARRPFVTVLNYEQGKAIAQAVTPGGMKIYIPPMPELVVTNAPESAPLEATAAPPPAVLPPAPPPKPMSVDEISEKLRAAEAERRERAAAESAAAQAETATAATALPPAEPPADGAQAKLLATPGEEPPEALPGETQAGPAVEEPVIIAAADQSSGEPAPVAPVSVEPALAASDQGKVAPMVEESDRMGIEAPAGGRIGEALPAEEPAEETVAGAADRSREVATPAVVLPERADRERLVYLGAGLVLLLAAVLLVWWRFHRPRRRVHASVISQSMHRRR